MRASCPLRQRAASPDCYLTASFFLCTRQCAGLAHGFTRRFSMAATAKVSNKINSKASMLMTPPSLLQADDMRTEKLYRTVAHRRNF